MCVWTCARGVSATVDGREACNVHVAHGDQVLSIRTRSVENEEVRVYVALYARAFERVRL